MPELGLRSANIKREDLKEDKYKSILDNPSYKKILLSNDTVEVEQEISKIKDKETLIELINYVVDSSLDDIKQPTNKYAFITLTGHFKELFGENEYNECFREATNKIREYNELMSIRQNSARNIDYDDFGDSYEDESINNKKPKKKWWSFGKNKKSKKNKNKNVDMVNQDLVLYSEQEKKLNKTKKKQSRGKGNWRRILKVIGGVVGSIVLGALSLVMPAVGMATIVIGGGIYVFRKATGKSKYTKKISNKAGGVIDKMEDAKIKSNTKKMENELNKFKKEDEQLKNKNKEEKNNSTNKQQNQTQNQQNTMMQNQQNPMMQNQQNPMMQMTQNQQNPMMQNQQNPMMQNQQNPMMQMTQQMMQQMMQNPAMWCQISQNPMLMQCILMAAQQMNQNPMTQWMNNFQQINNQNQQPIQQTSQQNTVQQQPINTFQAQEQQRAANNNQQNNGIGVR